MNGVAFAWFTTALVGLVTLLMLVVAGMLLSRAVRTRIVRFSCPWVNRDVTVHFLTCDRDQPIGVLSCTAFGDSLTPTCGRMCVGGETQEGLAEGERKVGDVLRG
jgi:hypothetical protein